MANGQMNGVLQHLRKLVAAQTTESLPDRDLLDRFVNNRDEVAFAALVERHGGMVLGVSMRVLHHVHDAEDACQAAFLVLARKSASIRKRDSLGSWLHGVAYHVATNLKRDLGRRGAHETPLAKGVQAEAAADITWLEMQAALDEELARLPAQYQAALVLCYLEGRTRDEAASQLGWSLGTLRGRLDRGRELLRSRLIRRGLTLSAALFGSALSQGSSSAAMPATLAVTTVKAAAQISAGKIAAAGVISAKVAALTEGMVKAMFITKLKIAVALLFLASLVGVGVGTSVLGHWTQAAEPAKQEKALLPRSEPAKEATAKQGKDQTLTLEEPVQRMCWSRDGKVMASLTIRVKEEGGKKIPLGTIRIWDAQTGKLKLSLGEVEYPGPPFLLMFDFTPDGKMLAIGQRFRSEVGDKVEFWDVEKGTLSQTIEMEYARGRGRFSISPDNASVAVCGCDLINDQGTPRTQGTVRVFDIKTANRTKKLVSKGSEIISTTFSSDGKVLAAGGHKGEITIWDLTTDKEVKTLTASAPVAALVFSPDSKHVVSGVGGSTTIITLWDIATGKARELNAPGPETLTQELAFSRDGRYLAGEAWVEKDGKRNYGVLIWDVQTGKLLREWQAIIQPRAYVNRAPGFAFTPDSKRLATLHDEKTVQFWEIADTVGQVEPKSAETLKVVATYEQNFEPVRKKPDGQNFESVRKKPDEQNPTDNLILRRLEELRLETGGAKGRPTATDADFIRRTYLDIPGTIPSPDEVEKFVKDKDPDKRTKLIDKLLDDPDNQRQVLQQLRKWLHFEAKKKQP